ncbi:MAG: hypothetical protein K2Y22_03010 [Candidatus Obscuribacterales bacterium]|nr:hypothetical protein [Candidatus Obscuribacterales bacterium]
MTGIYCWRAENNWNYVNYPALSVDRVPMAPPYIDATAEANNFKNEWERDSHFMKLGLSWITTHPKNFLELLIRRSWILFGEVRNTPTKNGDMNPSGWMAWTCVTFMLANRSIQLAALILTFQLWGQPATRQAAVNFFGLVAAYSLPYIFGWAYERHAIPLLLPYALYLSCLPSLNRQRT